MIKTGEQIKWNLWGKLAQEKYELLSQTITIVNDDSSIINNWHLSLTDDARVAIYDCNMFILQATGVIFETH